jgi:hypothetical protein
MSDHYVKKTNLKESGLELELRHSGMAEYTLEIGNRFWYYTEGDLVKLFEFLGGVIIERGLDKYLSFSEKSGVK